jgi:DNA mismatch repair ATPase MutS
MAGMPNSLIKRANEVLQQLEEKHGEEDLGKSDRKI